MFFEVLDLTYHSPITIGIFIYHVLLGTFWRSSGRRSSMVVRRSSRLRTCYVPSTSCAAGRQRASANEMLYVFIFRTLLQASCTYDRETPWPVLATRPTMIHEEGRTARRPQVLTDERG
jgi:hypothetical protein